MAKSRSIRRPEATTDSRSPEVRLEAFVREQYDDRADRMWARIIFGIEETGDIAPWMSAARTLSERLIISEDAFYSLVHQFSEALMFYLAAADPKLQRVSADIENLKRAHGLAEDEEWHIHEGPDEWRALNDQWNARADVALDERMRAAGVGDVLEMQESDPAQFRRRVTKGSRELFGGVDEEPPVD